MEFKISPIQLKEVLDLLATSTQDKGQAVLSHVKIESEGDDTIKLSATDLDTSIVTTLEADVVEEGSMCVSLRKLLGILKTLSSEVKIKKEDNNWARVTSGKSKFRLAGFDTEHFPEIPTINAFDVTIDQKTLVTLIKSTIFAISNEESRFALNAVKFEIADGIARVVATDASRVSVREAKATGQLNVLVPKKSLSQVVKLPKGDVEIGETLNHIFFKGGDFIISGRKLTGQFPDYKKVTDYPLPNTIIVGKDDLKNAVARAMLVSDAITHTLKLGIEENELVISANDNDGDFEDRLEAEYEGDPVVIAVNSTYFNDFLATAEGEKVHINFETPNMHLMLNGGNEEYKCLVMPLRV